MYFLGERMAELEIPAAFGFLFDPSRYKGAYGGRGSGKSHSFARALITQTSQAPMRILCARERQSSIKESVKQILDDVIDEHNLRGHYKSTNTMITGPGGSQFIFSGLHDQTVSSIKSLERVNRVWIEEAQTISQRSLDILIPTIREPGSEIWFGWNPDSEYDPVDVMFRSKEPPPDTVVKRVSYKDNPWFPDVLKDAMDFDRLADPDKAAHVWDGEYQQAPKGAYFARLLATALEDGRIGRVPHDPSLAVHVSWDLGNGINMCAVFSQWVGREVRIIDTLEGTEESKYEGWPFFFRELRNKPYSYGDMILPHDARPKQRTTGKGDEDAFIEAGFKTRIVPRMDPSERVRLIQGQIPMTWFDLAGCEKGLPAWKAYREDFDEGARVSRGPMHDWSSHFSSALGHLYQAYMEPRMPKKKVGMVNRINAWMN
jgi:phage terminase large subunit